MIISALDHHVVRRGGLLVMTILKASIKKGEGILAFFYKFWIDEIANEEST